MTRLFVVVVAGLALLPAAARADDGQLPAATIQGLKAAAVYIRCEAGPLAASGSGFLIHARDGTGLVITNHHVVTPPEDELMQALPRGRLRPGFPRAVPVVKITAVFFSGTPQERAAPATVLAADADRDLAVLQVTGVAGLPAPLDWRGAPQPTETQTVYVIGFPFGERLSVDERSNPAPTIGRSTVSSLRLNAKRELAQVQIEGEVHPGNSGGPVVDAAGRLVGVTVAKVRNTRIGFAIAAGQLADFLKLRILGGSFATLTSGDQTRVTATVRLLDAFGALRSGRLVYVPVEKLPAEPPADLATLPDSRTVEMRLSAAAAVGQFTLPTTGEVGLAWQAVLTDGRGGTYRTERKLVRLNHRAAEVARPTAPAPAQPPAANREKPADVSEPDLPAADPKAAGELAARVAAEENVSAKASLILIGPKAEPAVLKLLKHKDARVRRDACEILEEIGTPPTKELLADLSDDPDRTVRRAADKAIRAIVKRELTQGRKR